MERSDDELMAACARANDGAAFAMLVNRHEARLRLFLARSLPNDLDVVTEARDLAQDVFVEVWQRRASYQARGLFAAWLLRLARSRATSRGRSLQVRRLFALRSSISPSSSFTTVDGLDLELGRERAERVRKALAGLSRTSREIVTLRFSYDLDAAEIADVLHLAPGTVRVRLHRALAQLRENLWPDGELLSASDTLERCLPAHAHLGKEGAR